MNPTSQLHSNRPHVPKKTMAEQITLEHVRAVLLYVEQNSAITNREFRVATGLGYDTAIKIFGALCGVGMLRKTGESSGTKYVVAPSAKQNADKISLEDLTSVMDYVAKEGAITNSKCREAFGVSYNNSIRIFGALCSLGMLRKTGKSSTTEYVLAVRASEVPKRPGYHRKLNF